ncbi:MAG TPA: GHKL domain-containing protein [Spirochaetes bacterium]|nr:GHKL domain-containing protein [Spirochaetota bacterium]
MEDVQTLLSTITEGSDRTTSIIRDLKEYSRSRNKEIIQIDINEYIESTLNLLYNQFKGRIEIKKEYCSDSKIECHPGQVNQVLMNILVNAIQAIEDRGTIKIRTEKEKNNLDISILDTGKGIPQEVISTVFEPFFTTRGVGGGTGLGLSISYEIIQNHHGDIDIESEPGKGTIVQIKLPVKQYGDG